MVENFEDDDFPDEQEDASELVEAQAPVPVQKPRIGRPPMRREAPAQVKKEAEQNPEEDIYAAYHIPESTGIANKKTNQIVGNDILSILAKMLSKIEKIERATC